VNASDSEAAPLLKERITTMANNTTPCTNKSGIDTLAKDAKAKVDKIIAAHPELKLDLQPVSDSLTKIASDPHRL
jgi:hypothetical protein